MGVKVYSTPTCPWCKRTKEFLTEHKIPFKEINVAADQKAAEEMVQKSGGMSVPVIDIDGTTVVGFNQGEVATLLGINA